MLWYQPEQNPGGDIMPKRKRKKRGQHVNKYAHLSPKEKLYDEENKSRRCILIEASGLVPKGSVIPFHGRIYRAEYDFGAEGDGKKIIPVWCVLDRMLPGE